MVSEAGRQAVRAEWRTRRLGLLFPNGRGGDRWSEEIAGLMFVAIDNSTCIVGREQHAFYRSVIEAADRAGKSVVLLLHVPLFLDELKAAMAGDDGEGYYCGDASAGMQAPDAETLAFVETVVGQGGIELQYRSKCRLSFEFSVENAEIMEKIPLKDDDFVLKNGLLFCNSRWRWPTLRRARGAHSLGAGTGIGPCRHSGSGRQAICHRGGLQRWLPPHRFRANWRSAVKLLARRCVKMRENA